MDDNQEWGKQLNEERMMESLAVLQRVDRRIHTSADVLFLASALGLTTQFRQDLIKEAA